MIFSGKAPHQPIMQMLELPASADAAKGPNAIWHPYFVGTQSHPCLTSRPLSPDALFLGLVKAALNHAYPQQTLETITAKETKEPLPAVK